ncbi:hypothetical protein AMECASPLE_003459 [Ameca splendens]|uniref:Uncharacterized protein n=1 Tax=Ameca splendens TaxID=208324 RepID=A0ABV0XMM2_9TELE
MASSSLSGFSAHASTGLVSLWIMTLSYQLQLASSPGLLLLGTFYTTRRSSLGHRTPLLPEHTIARKQTGPTAFYFTVSGVASSESQRDIFVCQASADDFIFLSNCCTDAYSVWASSVFDFLEPVQDSPPRLVQSFLSGCSNQRQVCTPPWPIISQGITFKDHLHGRDCSSAELRPSSTPSPP